jgi:hypothetical protein
VQQRYANKTQEILAPHNPALSSAMRAETHQVSWSHGAQST